MKHTVRIKNRGQVTYDEFSDNIVELSLSACSKIIGMDSAHLEVLVDGEFLNLYSNDIAHVRHDMERIMHKNEKVLDFEIDGLFEF